MAATHTVTTSTASTTTTDTVPIATDTTYNGLQLFEERLLSRIRYVPLWRNPATSRIDLNMRGLPDVIDKIGRLTSEVADNTAGPRESYLAFVSHLQARRDHLRRAVRLGVAAVNGRDVDDCVMRALTLYDVHAFACTDVITLSLPLHQYNVGALESGLIVLGWAWFDFELATIGPTIQLEVYPLFNNAPVDYYWMQSHRDVIDEWLQRQRLPSVL